MLELKQRRIGSVEQKGRQIGPDVLQERIATILLDAFGFIAPSRVSDTVRAWLERLDVSRGVGRRGMIDNEDQAGRLFAELQAVLPLSARMTPELTATLRSGAAAAPLSPARSITSVSYAGDESGVMCELDLLNKNGKAIYVSITHLRFDPRLPAARDIANYQKHRVKHIRQGAG